RRRPTSDSLQHVEQQEDEGEACEGNPDGGKIEHQRWLLRCAMTSLPKSARARSSVAFRGRVVAPAGAPLPFMPPGIGCCGLAGPSSTASHSVLPSTARIASSSEPRSSQARSRAYSGLSDEVRSSST